MCIHLFFPQTIRLPDSKINKNIRLIRFLNTTTLTVDGLIESGDIMTTVWQKGINSFLPPKFKPQKVLLLGLAGGSNARLINKYYPQAKITAVEIDPVMVNIGRQYFHLDRLKNLHIIVDDAVHYVKNLRPSQTFDLVMIDCFVGKEIPKKLENIVFLKKIKKHSRFVLINRLWWREGKDASIRFFRSIRSRLFFVKAHTISNIVISLV
ncbi:MAG TPA: hypothetical protein PLI45_02210 [Candidatus Woesebacteria bacterium]|nr:hypothetical protein [Candidatus Woesebacteria bacterium]